MTTMTSAIIPNRTPIEPPPCYRKAVICGQSVDEIRHEGTQWSHVSQTDYVARASTLTHFKPIVIPQTTAEMLNVFLFPFTRAYPPCLARWGIDEQQFLAFLDGLNEAFVVSPAFRLLSAAGTLTSFAPSAIAMGVGVGVTLASSLTGAAVSYRRSRKYIEKHNAETFAPIGLQVSLVSTKKLAHMLDLPTSYERQTIVRSSDGDGFSCQRRVCALGNRVAPLKWNVAEARKPDEWMKRMGAWQARRSDASNRRKTAKQHERVRQARLDGNVEEWEKQQRKMEEKERKVHQRIRWLVIVPTV